MSELSLSSTTSSWVRSLNDGFGRNPDSELDLIASSSRFLGSLGIGPVRLLKLRSRRVKGSELNVFGNDPDSEL